MTEIKPGKRSFFKYASPNTALAILKSRMVRYSSPLLFNDPFDVQSGLHFDFDISSFHEKIIDKLEEYATAPNMPPVDESDPWGKVVKIIRENYPTYGFPREKFNNIAGELIKQLVDLIELTRNQYQDHWRKVLLPGLRVFCVSEERDNLLMWAHYAKDHTGVVFEFLSLPEEDNPLSVAQPIEYVSSPPPFFSAYEWLDEIFSVKRLDNDALYKRYAYIKSDHWSYEREWRVWYPLIPAPDSLYEDISIRQSEFVALYIGCKADPQFAEDAVKLAKTAFPSVSVYRAEKREDIYSLEYKEI